MTLTIKSYQASTREPLSEQKTQQLGRDVKSSLQQFDSNAAATVSISSSARALYTLTSGSEQAKSASKSDLLAKYEKGQSDVYNFGRVIAEGKYKKENLLPKSDDPNRLSLGERSLNFAIGMSKLPPKILPNPFEGVARNELSAIVYEGSETYTDAERYAAYGELSKQDEAYFSRLTLKITNGGDNRELFKGILDYFDDLPLIEQSAYPGGYRDSIDSLYEEQIGLWGEVSPIESSKEDEPNNSVLSLFNNQQSPQKMLQTILQRALEHPMSSDNFQPSAGNWVL